MFFLDINDKKIDNVRKILIRPEELKNSIIIFVMINSNIFLAINHNRYLNLKIKDKVYFCKLNCFNMKIHNNEYNENSLLKVVLEIEEEKDAEKI